MLLKTAARLLGLVRQVVWPRPFPGVGRYLYRLAIFTVLLPPFLLLQLVHWFGYLLDEILFRGYRRIVIREPVFVLGVPRSGTTFMHRLLAADPRFTTFATWECLFAPSISERYFWSGVAGLDRLVGRPLGRALGWLERRLFGRLHDIHPVSLDAAEEDYFVFLPVLTCFILIVPFPEADWLWDMARFDADVSAAQKRQLLRWYERHLQKHLYVHGSDRQLLSKNASFAGMANGLAESFPDARFVICERDAVHVIGSQFNSLAGGLRLFGVSPAEPRFRRRLLDSLAFYFENLSGLAAVLPEHRHFRVPLWNLSRETRQVVEALYRRFGLPMSAEVDAELRAYEGREAPKSPASSPSLGRWGIERGEVVRRFAAWRHEEAVRL